MDLAWGGKVRVALFPPQYGKNPATGELQGWPVSLARALGARLGSEILLVERPGPHEVLEDLGAGRCDVAFLPTDASWAARADFSPPFMEIDFTYLVPAGSSIRSVADADRVGARIAVVRNHASTLALSRVLRHAETLSAETPDAAFELLRTGHVDAFASLRPVLLDYSGRLPGSKVLQQHYGVNFLAMVVPKGQPARLAGITAFVEDAKASGLVREAIAHSGWRGVQVAPPGYVNRA